MGLRVDYQPVGLLAYRFRLSEQARIAVDAANNFAGQKPQSISSPVMQVGLELRTPGVELKNVNKIYYLSGKHDGKKPPYGLNHSVAHLVHYQEKPKKELERIDFYRKYFGVELEESGIETTLRDAEDGSGKITVKGGMLDLAVQLAVGALLVAAESEWPYREKEKLVVANEGSMALLNSKAVVQTVWENRGEKNGVARIEEINRSNIDLSSLAQALWVVHRDTVVS